MQKLNINSRIEIAKIKQSENKENRSKNIDKKIER